MRAFICLVSFTVGDGVYCYNECNSGNWNLNFCLGNEMIRFNIYWRGQLRAEMWIIGRWNAVGNLINSNALNKLPSESTDWNSGRHPSLIGGPILFAIVAQMMAQMAEFGNWFTCNEHAMCITLTWSEFRTLTIEAKKWMKGTLENIQS